MEELDIEVFRYWLEHHLCEVVGIADGVEVCPLAKWLSELEERPCWAGVSGWGYVGTEVFAYLPDWACSFVRAFDFCCAGKGPVTGAQVLAIVDEVVS